MAHVNVGNIELFEKVADNTELPAAAEPIQTTPGLTEFFELPGGFEPPESLLLSVDFLQRKVI